MSATRRKLRFNTPEEAVADARSLHEVGYQSLGSWNLEQTCVHLCLAMEESVVAPTCSLSLAGSLKALAGRVLILGLRRFPGGAPAPAVILPKTGSGSEADITACLERLHTAFALVTQATSFGTHPVLGNLTLAQWRTLHLVHAEHHLGHLIPRQPGASSPA